VELSTVRELFDLVASYRLPEGVIITTGTCDAEALAFARKNRITLIAGDEFLARFNRLPQMVRSRLITEVTTGDYTTPTCPRCNVKLVLRASELDQGKVWGCRRFPTCRYTMPAPATTATATA
jgi:restriction system protein